MGKNPWLNSHSTPWSTVVLLSLILQKFIQSWLPTNWLRYGCEGITFIIIYPYAHHIRTDNVLSLFSKWKFFKTFVSQAFFNFYFLLLFILGVYSLIGFLIIWVSLSKKMLHILNLCNYWQSLSFLQYPAKTCKFFQ